MNKRLLTMLCMIILIAVAMTAVVAVASASVDTLDYIYKGEYAHGIAGYSNDSVIVFGQANEIADEEYGIAIREGESYKYFKADSVGTTGKFGIAFPAESIPDGEYKAYAYLKASNGDYVLGNEVDLVLNAGGDYTVNVVITDGVASWIAPAGTYSTVVKLNGVDQVVSGTSFDLSESQNYVDGTNLVEVECLTKSGYVYTGSATMNIVEINADNFADIDAYSENDYLVLTQDIDVTDYFSTFKDVYSTEMDVISATGILKSTFDGNGHKISYTHTRNADVYFAGVFAGISDTGVLKNTRFDLEVTDSGTNNTHPVAGTTFGKVKDCYIEMDVNGTNTSEKMSAFGSTYDKEGTSAASFENTIVNIPTLTTGGWINRAIGFGLIGVPSNWYEDVSVATQVSLKNVALISSQAFAPSYSRGNRDGVWVALSSEEFLDGNVWSLTNSDEYGWYSYSKSRSVQDTDYKGLKTNVSWTDSAWTKGVWDLSSSVTDGTKTSILKWNNQVIFENSISFAVEMSASSNGASIEWTDIASSYDVYATVGQGSETLIESDITGSSYTFAKSDLAQKDGALSVRVVAKDGSGNEILSASDDGVTLVGSVATLKTVSDGTYLMTSDLTLTNSDYTVYHLQNNGVDRNIKSVVERLTGKFYGAGYKITSKEHDGITANDSTAFAGVFLETMTGSVIDGTVFDISVKTKENARAAAVVHAHYGMMSNCYVIGYAKTSSFVSTTTNNAVINFSVAGSMVTWETYSTIKGSMDNVIAVITSYSTSEGADCTSASWGFVYGENWASSSTSVNYIQAKAPTFTDCILVKTNWARFEKFSFVVGTKTNCYVANSVDNFIGKDTSKAIGYCLPDSNWLSAANTSSSWTSDAFTASSTKTEASTVTGNGQWNNSVWTINSTGITLYGTTVYIPVN